MTMPFNKQLTLPLILLTWSLYCTSSFAEGLINDQDETVPIMPRVEVEAVRITPTTGSVLVDKELIENLPTRNGSINEIISIVPGVQLGEKSNDSFTSGEIAPPNISISGSRFYDNNYTIDGLSNNNPVDPINNDIASSTNDTNKLPSHQQTQFLSSRLIEQIKVYSSNIPAEHGGFSGGQINTETINPTEEFWGEINYRTTRDNWTKFHISPDDEDKFKNSDEVKFQPEFKKEDFGGILNFPISIHTGLLVSYQQLNSKIPLKNLDEKETQTRKHENYFAKLNHNISGSSNISFTAIYSPNNNEYFLTDWKDSKYKIKSEAITAITNYESNLFWGLFNLTFGFNGRESKRSAAKDRFWWDASQPSIDWSTGKEGSLGNLEIGHDDVNLKFDFTFNNLLIKNTDHQIKVGAEATYSRQYYNRPEESYYYRTAKTGSIVCNPDVPACIPDEQYLKKRTRYFAVDRDTESTDVAAFVQDTISWKRLEIFPGIRTSYDDITNDLNFAPRLSASLDLFDNRKTVLFSGLNRYYSGTLHTFELYKAIRSEQETRETPTDPNTPTNNWTSKPSSIRKSSDIKTPYSDEITIGILQRILGGELKLQYIEKKNRDEFAVTRVSERDEDNNSFFISTLNNNGRSEHESYLVSWQRSWINHFFEINSTWQETTTSHGDYNDIFDDEDLEETVWYQGKEIPKYELPRKDFNRPVVANLIYSGKFPFGISFTNVAKLRGPYEYFKFVGREPSRINPDNDILVYEKKKHKRSLLFDWKITWEIPTFRQQRAVLNLDIYNLFNRRTNYGAGADDFELGRQFWAGLTYKF